VIGFDIVDEEDRYLFHTGETEWNKMSSENLYDALLLNTTRIGHGFALHNYPFLMKEIRERDIAVEVNPISNQMLRLLDDIRDHPAIAFLNNAVPVTINSDDSVVYGNHGLTYDFWASCVSWNLTLSGLKKLTQNSIKYSSLPQSLKKEKMSQLDQAWVEWINRVTSKIEVIV